MPALSMCVGGDRMVLKRHWRKLMLGFIFRVYLEVPFIEVLSFPVYIPIYIGVPSRFFFQLWIFVELKTDRISFTSITLVCI